MCARLPLAYSLYDKPLFTGSSANVIYKPRKGLADEYADPAGGDDAYDTHTKLKPQRALGGAGGSLDAKEERTGPVLFEKAASDAPSRAAAPPVADDPFGLDQFLQEAKLGKRKEPAGDPASSSRAADPHKKTDAPTEQAKKPNKYMKY